jgi:hypothetical protein
MLNKSLDRTKNQSITKIVHEMPRRKLGFIISKAMVESNSMRPKSEVFGGNVVEMAVKMSDRRSDCTSMLLRLCSEDHTRRSIASTQGGTGGVIPVDKDGSLGRHSLNREEC